MSPKFRTSYDKLDTYSVSGSGTDDEYSAYYDGDGVLQLEVIGKKDIYSEIQSYKDSCDINLLMLRYTRGETDVFAKVQGFYADATKMPQTYQDCLNHVLKTEQFFNSLPIEEKQKFNNDFAQFLVSLDDPDFLDRFEAVKIVNKHDDDDVKESSDES